MLWHRSNIFKRIAALCVLAFSGCISSNEDLFYKNTAGFDYDRLPLIKPFEAINPRTGHGNIYGYADHYKRTDAKGVEQIFVTYLLNPDSVFKAQDLFDNFAKTNTVPWHP